MRKIYIIISENTKNIKFIYNLFYYFRNFDYKIIDISQLGSIDKRDLIIFNKCYHPFKNQLEKILNIDNNFYYLSKDKNIYFVPKDKYIFENSYLDIQNCENSETLNIFDDTEEYNYIDHEEMIDIKNYILHDFNVLCQLLKMTDIHFLFNKNIPIELIQEYIKIKIPNAKIYNHVFIIDNKNIDAFCNFLGKTSFNNNYSRYNIFLNMTYLDYETENKIKFITNKFKINKLVYNVYFINNIVDVKYILDNNILYFEYIIIYNNINKEINANNYLKYYQSVITNEHIIIPATMFVRLYISKNEYKLDRNHFLRLIKLFIASDARLNVYCDKNIKKYKKIFLPGNYSYVEKMLFFIKDYEQLLGLIDKRLKITYSSQETSVLLVKKITTSILTQKEDVLNEQLLHIFSQFDNVDQLKDIEVLVSQTKFNKIKKNIYIKLFDKITDNYSLINNYLSLALNHSPEEADIKIIIKKLNSDKQILENIADKNILLLLILRSVIPYLDNTELIDMINDFIKNNYFIKNIDSIDSLLQLGKIIKDNKFLVLIILMLVATKFDNYYKTYDDFIKAREKIKNNLLYIQNKINTDIIFNINLKELALFSIGNFDLSYQGIPSPEIFKLKCEIYRNICPELNYEIDTDFHNEKIKVLFHASQLTRLHSVYKDRHQVIKALSLDPRFEVFFSTFDELTQEVKFTYGNAKHILLTRDLNSIRNKLSKMKLDIIVYCEIGMDNISYFMAYMKLARYQCNTWGHSDTSGINTIDYFISSKLYELDYKTAQTHYTEKLILQNSLCTSYINPLLRHNIKLFKPRSFFGFADDTIIYFCVQSLFKFNPIFDDYIVQILSQVSNSVLIMLDSNHKYKFIERFNNKKVADRIHFFPGMNHMGFMNLMNISDVILDIYPFGGCNSSMEAFSLGKVIVTQASTMINGRFTAGFYTKMGLSEYITKNKKEYTNFAIKLGNKKLYRNFIEKQIMQKKDILFSDQETITEWKNDLINISEGRY